MSNIDRKVNRNQSNYNFTKKEEKKKTKLDFFTDNFSFKWLHMSTRLIIYIMLDFIAVSIIFIPLLAQMYATKLAFVLAHTFITSLLVVSTVYFTSNEKPPLLALLLRYLFIMILLFAVSIISVNIIG